MPVRPKNVIELQKAILEQQWEINQAILEGRMVIEKGYEYEHQYHIYVKGQTNHG